MKDHEVAIREKLRQPEKLRLTEDELTNIKEECGCDKDDEYAAKEVKLEGKLHIKGPLKDVSQD